MRFARLVSLATLVFLTMSAVPAFAACAFGCSGGVDAFFYRTQYLWPGQTVTWDTTAYLDKAAAGPDDGPFFAYLVEAGRRSGRVPHVDGGVQLGTVETSTGRDRYSLDVSVNFSVPASTPLGDYVVEVCNDPCANRLGYLWATPMEGVSGDIEARLNGRIDALSQKVANLRGSIKASARRAAKSSSKVLRGEMSIVEEKLDMQVSELALRVTELERQVASRKGPEERNDVSRSVLAGWVVMLLLCGWLLFERRRSRESHPPWDSLDV